MFRVPRASVPWRVRFLPLIVLAGFSCCLAEELVLNSAREVLDLSGEEAGKRHPIGFRGTVTYTESSWAGQFFVQDDTGGVFVRHSGKPAPEPGEIVDIQGVSHPGAFAPIIDEPAWTVVGRGPLPVARAISMERFASGVDDGLRVEVSGRVRRMVRGKEDRSTLIMSSGDQRFEVMVRTPSGQTVPNSWVGSIVRVRGVLGVDYQLHRRGLAMVRVFVATPDEVVVEQAEEIDPFQCDVLPLSRVGQYRRDLAPGQRSRVRGVVVAVFGPDSLAIEDESGGLILKGGDLAGFHLGDPVEAVGFEGLENFLPVLQDCVVSRPEIPGGLPEFLMPTVEDLILGRHHACLVELEAELIDISPRPAADGGTKGREVVLVLHAEGRVFKADFADAGEEDSALPFRSGSRVRLAGLCLAEANREGRVDSFRLRLAGPDGISVLRPPPWLDRRRMGVALLSTAGGLALCGGWVLSASRRNRRLRAEIREREKLTAELQQAKRKLALRVDERTEELKLQISARKESEVRFKAVIGERTRLAQELHDGLQQGMTGVALQLDTAVRLRERAPDQSLRHLELARTLMRQTHADLRSSVWNLRSRGSGDFSLLEALRQSSGRLTEGTGVSVEVHQTGTPRSLPELHEENLLRIGQEALTNALKHAGSERMEIELDYGDSALVLRIRDFGRGFDRESAQGPEQGHFGLSGMAERAQRIGGTLTVSSEPGRGTVIEATLPFAPEPSLS